VFQRVVEPDERISSLSACHGVLRCGLGSKSLRKKYLLLACRRSVRSRRDCSAPMNTSAPRATAAIFGAAVIHRQTLPKWEHTVGSKNTEIQRLEY
jgi:hypothetical protein